jgi:hypothetical protein
MIRCYKEYNHTYRYVWTLYTNLTWCNPKFNRELNKIKELQELYPNTEHKTKNTESVLLGDMKKHVTTMQVNQPQT